MDISEYVSSSLVFFIVLCTLLYYYSISTYDYWKKRGVKYLEPLPLIGSSVNIILRNKFRAYELQEHYNRFGNDRFIGWFQFRTPTLFVRDPDLIQSILASDFSHFADRGLFRHTKIDKLSAHLLTLNGERWKNLRRKLNPAFSSGKLKNMLDELKKCTAELGQVLEAENELVQVRDLMTRFSIRVIGSIAFGCDFNTLRDAESEFFRKAQQMFKISLRTVVAILMDVFTPRLRNVLGFKQMAKEDEDYYLNFVNDTVTYREQNNVERKDFLQLLINLKKEDASGTSKCLQGLKENQDGTTEGDVILDDKLIASNVFIFFLAGFETTASTLGYCLLELAANPDVQQKLREEVVTRTKGNFKEITYEMIKSMSYMDKVLAETLRKYPVVHGLGRECTKAYRIPGTDVVIDPGVMVSIPVFSIHRDPQYYPEPEVFNPERFSEENKQKRRNGTYLPFGDGPRNCIGMRFAQLEMKIAVSFIVSHYHLSLSDRTRMPLEFATGSVFLRPTDGIWLRVKNISA